jgi:hypothetical protein
MGDRTKLKKLQLGQAHVVGGKPKKGVISPDGKGDRTRFVRLQKGQAHVVGGAKRGPSFGASQVFTGRTLMLSGVLLALVTGGLYGVLGEHTARVYQVRTFVQMELESWHGKNLSEKGCDQPAMIDCIRSGFSSHPPAAITPLTARMAVSVSLLMKEKQARSRSQSELSLDLLEMSNLSMATALQLSPSVEPGAEEMASWPAWANSAALDQATFDQRVRQLEAGGTPLDERMVIHTSERLLTQEFIAAILTQQKRITKQLIQSQGQFTAEQKSRAKAMINQAFAQSKVAAGRLPASR